MMMARWNFRQRPCVRICAAGPALADPVGLTSDMMSVTVETAGGPVEIMREQDNARRLEGDWTLTSRPCPNVLHPADGARRGRDPGGRAGGFGGASGSGHDPHRRSHSLGIRGRHDPRRDLGALHEAADRLGEFGCEIDFDGWICEGDLPQVVLFCNGPWCGQSPTAARRMIEAGFPAENISYYRGGMQNWNMLGLTVVPGGAGG
jgi:rhodanese-related sulfurtransferase